MRNLVSQRLHESIGTELSTTHQHEREQLPNVSRTEKDETCKANMHGISRKFVIRSYCSQS